MALPVERATGGGRHRRPGRHLRAGRVCCGAAAASDQVGPGHGEGGVRVEGAQRARRQGWRRQASGRLPATLRPAGEMGDHVRHEAKEILHRIFP